MRRALAAALLLLAVAACSGTSDDAPDARPTPPGTTAAAAEPTPTATEPVDPAHTAHPAGAGRLEPLRAGEQRRTLTMPAAYTPSAPTGVGTDDYRCFLLDPQLKRDAWLTGTNVLPGNPDVVHHVILFRVSRRTSRRPRPRTPRPRPAGLDLLRRDGPRRRVRAARRRPVARCLGAGRRRGRHPRRLRHRARPGQPDRHACPLQPARRARARHLGHPDPHHAPHPDLTALHTFLLPGPVELPCRPGRDDNPLCDRDAAVADAKERFGQGPGATADLLYFLCGGKPEAARTSSCTRRVQQPLTILGAAGHMHLLGTKISIETRPGTPEARTILDIPVWDFDDQGSRPIDPVHLDTWDEVEVTCTHSQALRDRLPAFETQREDKYVVWGEGTTDEMCLGMLSVAFDDAGRGAKDES